MHPWIATAAVLTPVAMCAALLWRHRRGRDRLYKRLERQLADGTVRTIDMPEFEGARVRHRATPIAVGDLRVILSMTYCDDPRISRTKEVARRVKDTAYYGIRALWD